MSYFNSFLSDLALLLAQTSSEELNEKIELISEVTLPKVIKAVIVIVVTYWGSLTVDKILNWFSERVALRFRLTIKQSLPFWRALLLTVAVVFLSGLFLNLSPQNLVAVTGTIAVALGFAFKDYASSVIAGIIALFERPYQVGDRVKIGDHYGEIISYGLRDIRLQTADDNVISIPHNKIWTEAISNANDGSVEAQVVTDFYFNHRVDVEKVIRILYRVAYTSKYTQLKLPVLVVMDEKPWGTHFKLKCYPIDARDEFIYKTDLIRRSKQAFYQLNLNYPILAPGNLESIE
ncbi:MAG: mechanosensitive ion channel family protein [Microcoleaceae cyanobacterium]